MTMGVSACQRSSQHPLPQAQKAQARAQQAYMHLGLSANVSCLLVLHAVWPSQPIANPHASGSASRSAGPSGCLPPAIASAPSEKS